MGKHKLGTASGRFRGAGRGKARRNIAPGFSTRGPPPGLLTVFLRTSVLSCGDPRPYTARRLVSRRPLIDRPVHEATCRSERSSPTTAGGRRRTASVCGCGRAPVGWCSHAVARRAARSSRPEPAVATRAPEVGRVLSQGRPFHGGRVVAFVAPGSGNVAFVAGRRVGGAVVRNRARRVLRAAWSELRPRAVPDSDIVLVARSAIRGTKTQDLVAELTDLLTRARVLE